ncbi:MAG: ATP-dependent zinc metalloprotease FtsH [Chloroflexi bacterium]|nr:MAG: ATP-dependent zinc metalloprotease FtsH [Chloroflexota bacterium]
MAEHPVTRFRRLLRLLVARARRRPRLTLLSVLLLAIAVGAAGTLVALSRSPVVPAPIGPVAVYSATWTLPDLTRHAEAGDVAAITVPRSAAGDPPAPAILVARTRDGALVRVDLTVDPGAAASALASLGHGDLLTADAWALVRSPRSDATATDPLRTILGWVIPLSLVALLILFVNRMARGGARGEAGGGFMTILPGRRRPDGRPDAGPPDPGAIPPVRLADVAGCEEAKLELTETIEFLRSPARFQRLGARIPHGVLLFGPPGTGKTMLARAVAAEAEVPFLAASGAEFIEKYVGVGSRRVRELFAQARSHGRAVIFIDEFDALGKARGGANSHEEREQTLNQLLIELDGFTSTDGVVVIGATNRVDVLDPAVLRPGRFGRKIHVGLPDVVGRREILTVHSRGKPFEPAVDLDVVARKTYGFSGAQLADLLNEAAILAARRKGDMVSADDVHGGWLKVAVGTGRRRSMDERERSIIAAHEVGHAICGRIHGDRRKVEEISLFAHGEALGVTVSSQEDNDLPAESDLRARLVALMGGRAAEELLFQEVTGGAANDFEQANRIATSMVTRWGMGRDPESNEHGTSGRGSLSFLVARNGGTLPSDVQAAATRATRAILDEAYAEACRTLLEHMDLLRRLAAYLVEHERVDGDTFDALVDGKIEVPNALDEWRPAAARPRAWADIPTWHAGRGKPVVLPVPVVAALPAPIEPAREPLPVPVTLPIPIREARRRLPGERRRTVAGQLSRRLRRLAVGYVDGAKQWFWSGEGDPEA